MCQLADRADDYRDKPVSVSAILFSDWDHSAGLISAECPTQLLSLSSGEAKSIGYDRVWDGMLKKRGKADIAFLVRVDGFVRDSSASSASIKAQKYTLVKSIPTPPELEARSKWW